MTMKRCSTVGYTACSRQMLGWSSCCMSCRAERGFGWGSVQVGRDKAGFGVPTVCTKLFGLVWVASSLERGSRVGERNTLALHLHRIRLLYRGYLDEKNASPQTSPEVQIAPALDLRTSSIGRGCGSTILAISGLQMAATYINKGFSVRVPNRAHKWRSRYNIIQYHIEHEIS